MADTPDADQKTESPSPKRLREAAERGDVLQSRELGTALVIVAATIWLMTAAPALFSATQVALRIGLSFDAPNQPFDPQGRVVAIARPLLAPMLTFAGIAVAGLLAGPLLTSARFSGQALLPKVSRINPAAGLMRMFGMQAPIELGKALLKAGLLFGTGYLLIKGLLPALLSLGRTGLDSASAQIGGAIAALLRALTAALLIIAGVDLPVQMSRYFAKLRMTKQEVKDEAKESEGSPETKAAIRRMQHQAARRALRPAMAEATVVVVNPSHFAVALRYDPARDTAPVVVAKGRELIAAAIRDLASERTVPILRYPQLTRAIYFTAKVGEPIRDDLYNAVAAVLAFVFSLDQAAHENRDQPEVEIPRAVRFDEHGALDV